MWSTIDNVRIESLKPLISPAILIEEYPLDTLAVNTVKTTRDQASNIIHARDDRLLIVVGPCSIHDVKAALDYGNLLQNAIGEFQDQLCLVMRVYFEKPRTTIGWKGLINDPDLNGTYNINHGLKLARELLFKLNQMGVPTGTEFLDTIIPQFISDLISWGAIGARTTESQIHRELASGLSMPVGFKNGTSGGVQLAIDAISSAKYPHHFLSVTKHGIPAIVSTMGNRDCHVILRGGKHGPNYSADQIKETVNALTSKGINTGVMVDCSHGNSQKDYKKQSIVAADLAKQIKQGNSNIRGLMLESNLVAGKQDLLKDKQPVYGQSITDACMAWDETHDIIEQLAEAVEIRRQQSSVSKQASQQ